MIIILDNQQDVEKAAWGGKLNCIESGRIGATKGVGSDWTRFIHGRIFSHLPYHLSTGANQLRVFRNSSW